MRNRPAETAGGLGAAATAVAALLGASTETVAAIGVVAGVLPGGVTWIVKNGGLRGLFWRFWRGA